MRSAVIFGPLCVWKRSGSGSGILTIPNLLHLQLHESPRLLAVRTEKARSLVIGHGRSLCVASVGYIKTLNAVEQRHAL